MRALLLGAVLVAAALPARAQTPDGLAGTWTMDHADLESDTLRGALLAEPGLRSLTFSTSGTAIVRVSFPFYYTVEDDSLEIDVRGGGGRFALTLDGDSLDLGDFEPGQMYGRIGGEASDGIVGFWKQAGDARTASEAIEFGPDRFGALVYDSVSPFEVTGRRLSIAMDLRDGPPTQDVTIRRLDAGTLVLTQAGVAATFTRPSD